MIVRKAYGAGLYAMDGPGFMPDACIALPTARIAVMGPQAAINAVYANKIEAIDDPVERDAFVSEKRTEYEKDVDVLRLASELVLDGVIEPQRTARRTDRALSRAGRQEARCRWRSATVCGRHERCCHRRGLPSQRSPDRG